MRPTRSLAMAAKREKGEFMHDALAFLSCQAVADSTRQARTHDVASRLQIWRIMYAGSGPSSIDCLLPTVGCDKYRRLKP